MIAPNDAHRGTRSVQRATAGFQKHEGCARRRTQPDSPAAKAGIKSGDIITSLNGDAVENPRTLSKKIAATAPGMPLKLGVFRQGNEETMQVTLGELPCKGPAAGGK